ncbi:MFS transporter [Neofusicoccum parvum]|uniref:MFS transporter n=1 Tax=Neofusicoccum parvum TaxID=310453 RepID=A0ACB5RVC4_9PEZI|nr:MFS transporter [Neofusicoccum parvum]
MAIWGIISCCTGVTQGAGGIYACRFFLGVFEAAYYPGALFLISSWYRRSELGVRCAILFSGSQHGSAFSGLIGAGIEHSLDGARGLESWRWLFLIEGGCTVFIALFDEDNDSWTYGPKMAFVDWRLYLFAFLFLCIQVLSATSSFFPSVVETLGFGKMNTLLLTVPPYIISLLITMTHNRSADHFQNSP